LGIFMLFQGQWRILCTLLIWLKFLYFFHISIKNKYALP
jgi:hypothetical protein